MTNKLVYSKIWLLQDGARNHHAYHKKRKLADTEHEAAATSGIHNRDRDRDSAGNRAGSDALAASVAAEDSHQAAGAGFGYRRGAADESSAADGELSREGAGSRGTAGARGAKAAATNVRAVLRCDGERIRTFS